MISAYNIRESKLLDLYLISTLLKYVVKPEKVDKDLQG